VKWEGVGDWRPGAVTICHMLRPEALDHPESSPPACCEAYLPFSLSPFPRCLSALTSCCPSLSSLLFSLIVSLLIICPLASLPSFPSSSSVPQRLSPQNLCSLVSIPRRLSPQHLSRLRTSSITPPFVSVSRRLSRLCTSSIAPLVPTSTDSDGHQEAQTNGPEEYWGTLSVYPSRCIGSCPQISLLVSQHPADSVPSSCSGTTHHPHH